MLGISNNQASGVINGSDHWAAAGQSSEWLRGDKICTFNGKYHLAWSVPMSDPSYLVPGAQIHSFLMYAPFFALWEKKGMIIQGAFLFFTGPFLAAWVSSNLFEQASIWCFFSIAQITSMLFLIRETLIVHWGKEEHRVSLLAGRAAAAGGDSPAPARATRSAKKAPRSASKGRSSSRKTKRG
jgi:hypothetical protein